MSFVLGGRQLVRIHGTADVSPEAAIGEGTAIWHHAQVRKGARVGRDCILGKGVYVDFDVVIGDNCKLQNGVYVYHPAAMGDGVFLGAGVILTNDRLPRAVNPDGTLKRGADWEARPVTVGSGASVGAGSVVLPGITVGRWAMVGAGSVVTRDVPDYGLAWGNPAGLRGFVCPCGQRLRQVDDGLEEALETIRLTCPACGFEVEVGRETYERVGGRV